VFAADYRKHTDVLRASMYIGLDRQRDAAIAMAAAKP
jgi:hypothetical protein